MNAWTVEAIIMPKDGVNDPQGEAIKDGLKSLEFEGIMDVRAGKQIAILLEAESEDEALAEGAKMCDQLLANPVIERYSLSVSPVDSTTKAGSP